VVRCTNSLAPNCRSALGIGHHGAVGAFLSDWFHRMEDAKRKPLAEVIAADEAAPMDDAEFDDAVVISLSQRVESPADLRALSAGIRMYFATRLVEWEIANGGFAQAVENAAEYFNDAVAGYRLLGDEASADLIPRAQAMADDEHALQRLDDEVDGEPWNGVPWSDETRVRYLRAHRDEFRLQ
jgi:hypothetical protein